MIIIQLEDGHGVIEEIYPKYFLEEFSARKHLEYINANNIVEKAPWGHNVFVIHPNADRSKRIYARLIELTMES